MLMSMSGEFDALVAAADDVLRLDVRAVHQGRGASAAPDAGPARHQCVVDGFCEQFVDGRCDSCGKNRYWRRRFECQ